METILFIVIICLLLAGIAVAGFLHTQNRFKRARPLKERYEVALRAGNETEARNAGRTYFSALRGGRSTYHDEIKTDKDLSVIKKDGL